MRFVGNGAIRRLLAGSVRFGLHVATLLMFAAGSAAMVAMIAVAASSSDATWMGPLQRIAQSIAFTFFPAAIVAFLLMPSLRQFMASRKTSEEHDLPAALSVVLVGLTVPVASRIPSLVMWWSESLRAVEQVRGGESDRLGLWVFPAAAVVCLPVLATMSIAVFGLTSAAAWLGRPVLAFRLLVACAVLQTGLVLGNTLLLEALRNVFATVLSLMAASPDDQIRAGVTEAIGRHDAFAGTLLPWFQWTTVGYCLSACAAWYVSPASGRSDARPAVSRPSIAPDREALVFPRDQYSVRLRTSWLAAAFRVGSAEYVITPVPTLRDDAKFSFSEATGVLRREPGGPELLIVQRESGLIGKRRYAVSDRPTGAKLVTFERAGRDWEVVDATGQPIAHIEEADARSGFRRYVATVEGREVCRYTWALQGLGVWTAELDVEFLGRGVQGFDRSVAMALAPLLEQDARRDNQRHTS